MATILVDYSSNELLKCHIQTLHHIDLYEEYLYQRISNIEYKAIDTYEELLGKSYSNWAVEELLKLGVVSIYHFWKKSVILFLNNQSKRQNITLLSKKRKSVVAWVIKTLEYCFETPILLFLRKSFSLLAIQAINSTRFDELQVAHPIDKSINRITTQAKQSVSSKNTKLIQRKK